MDVTADCPALSVVTFAFSLALQSSLDQTW